MSTVGDLACSLSPDKGDGIGQTNASNQGPRSRSAEQRGAFQSHSGSTSLGRGAGPSHGGGTVPPGVLLRGKGGHAGPVALAQDVAEPAQRSPPRLRNKQRPQHDGRGPPRARSSVPPSEPGADSGLCLLLARAPHSNERGPAAGPAQPLHLRPSWGLRSCGAHAGGGTTSDRMGLGGAS